MPDSVAPISTIESKYKRDKNHSLKVTMLDTRLINLSHLIQQQQQHHQQQQQQHHQQQQHEQQRYHSSGSALLQHHQPMHFLPNFAQLAAMKNQLTSSAVASFAQQQLATAEWIKSQLALKQTEERLNPHFLEETLRLNARNPDLTNEKHSDIHSRVLPPTNEFHCKPEHYNQENRHGENSITHSEGKCFTVSEFNILCELIGN